MKIFGLYYGHDCSICYVDNGRIIFNLQEERVSGIKHSIGPPLESLDLLREYTKINLSKIDAIAVPYLSRIPQLATIFGKRITKTFQVNKFTNWNDLLRELFVRSVVNIGYLKIGGGSSLPLYKDKYRIPETIPIFHVDHHLSHAASAYYTSGFNKCLVVTADGQGDYCSTTAWLAEDGRLKPLIKIKREGSLGFFYSIVTEALGWQINDGEGKTMGLAPYGNFQKVKGKLDFIVPIYKDGYLATPRYRGFMQGWDYNGAIHIHFPESKKVEKIAQKYGREQVAAEAQRLLEEQMLNFLTPWLQKTGSKKLAAAGGVFLNVKMNQRIWETGLLEDFYIYPDAGDSGGPIGAALYIYYNSRNSFKPKRLRNLYWGPKYNDSYIEHVLKVRHVKYQKFNNTASLVLECAKKISENKIIGWFQNRMESGPRALGNRSILMSPIKAINKDIINSRVKFREGFRPFCPSMTEKAAKKYLINPISNPSFMIISFNVPDNKIDEIPAVVHVDKTTRPQVVTKNSNPLFFQLLKSFGKLTGVEVLLNTSFNIKGFPIVCTPEDAIKCFYNTGMDYLFLGNFMLGK